MGNCRRKNFFQMRQFLFCMEEYGTYVCRLHILLRSDRLHTNKYAMYRLYDNEEGS